jgi:hypothetical protein
VARRRAEDLLEDDQSEDEEPDDGEPDDEESEEQLPEEELPEDEPTAEKRPENNLHGDEASEEVKERNDYNSIAPYQILHALARTCRTLYPVARQTLYEQYRADSEKPIIGYIHRLAAEPSLRPYVKHIHITNNQALGKLRAKEEIIDELQHVVTFGSSFFDATQDAAAL